jgi:uncharacterized protein YkwD
LANTRLLLAAVTSAAAMTIPAPAASADPGNDMVGQVNDARGLNGLGRTHFSSRLSRAARAWARHLMSNGRLAHSVRAMRCGQGEVIEWHTGTAPQVPTVVSEWLGSSGHRRVMLRSGWHKVGAGRAVGTFGGQRSTIWVVRFAR